MNCPRRLLAAGIILVALMGADGPKSCQTTRPGKVESNRTDQATEPNPLRERKVYIEAHGDRRYRVIVTTTLHGRVAPDYRSDNWVDHPDAGKYKQTFRYESGQKHDVVVTVRADPNNDPDTNGLSCLIKDGGHSEASTGPALVQCNLTTDR